MQGSGYVYTLQLCMNMFPFGHDHLFPTLLLICLAGVGIGTVNQLESRLPQRSRLAAERTL